MKLNIQAFLNSLVFMGEGMLGIFAVDVYKRQGGHGAADSGGALPKIKRK